MDTHYDFVIVGSGFGGSVSALRLAEKGYRVLVIEKGRRFALDDFPKSNWDLRRWMWRPGLGLRGIFAMSFFRHVTILHGVGVGGGSLTYANTLPLPKTGFFRAPSWAHLADWEPELAPHYRTARRMLGSATNPRETIGDRVLQRIAADIGRPDHYHPTDVAVFFGEPGRRVPDPYFGGEGPERAGCTFCGACMTGCRVGAKNTLDRNYLWLAEQRGVRIEPETEVCAVRARSGGGFVLETDASIGPKNRRTFTADRVVLAGGVLGTVPLLLRMAADPEGLPRLSPRVGDMVRTNSEALMGVVAPKSREDFTEGVAITSILHTDEHSHIEPVRYGPGSGFFRTLMLPHAPGPNAAVRMAGAARGLVRHPLRWARALTTPDFSRHSQVLLYMRTLDSTILLPARAERLDGLSRGARHAARRSVARADALHAGGDRSGQPLRRRGRGRRRHDADRDADRYADDRPHPRGRVHGGRPRRGRHRQRAPRLRLRWSLRDRRCRRLGEPRCEPVLDHHGHGRARHDAHRSPNAIAPPGRASSPAAASRALDDEHGPQAAHDAHEITRRASRRQRRHPPHRRDARPYMFTQVMLH